MTEGTSKDIIEAFEYVSDIYRQVRLILIDLEELLEKDFIFIFSKNNGSKPSRSFKHYFWLPKYITRYFRKEEGDIKEGKIVGIGVLFYQKNIIIPPLFSYGIFTPKDILKYPSRSEYNCGWLSGAWFEDGDDDKIINKWYKFNCKHGHYWYDKVSIKSIELTDIKTKEEIDSIYKDLTKTYNELK